MKLSVRSVVTTPIHLTIIAMKLSSKKQERLGPQAVICIFKLWRQAVSKNWNKTLTLIKLWLQQLEYYLWQLAYRLTWWYYLWRHLTRKLRKHHQLYLWTTSQLLTWLCCSSVQFRSTFDWSSFHFSGITENSCVSWRVHLNWWCPLSPFRW